MTTLIDPSRSQDTSSQTSTCSEHPSSASDMADEKLVDRLDSLQSLNNIVANPSAFETSKRHPEMTLFSLNIWSEIIVSSDLYVLPFVNLEEETRIVCIYCNKTVFQQFLQTKTLKRKTLPRYGFGYVVSELSPDLGKASIAFHQVGKNYEVAMAKGSIDCCIRLEVNLWSLKRLKTKDRRIKTLLPLKHQVRFRCKLETPETLRRVPETNFSDKVTAAESLIKQSESIRRSNGDRFSPKVIHLTDTAKDLLQYAIECDPYDYESNVMLARLATDSFFEPEVSLQLLNKLVDANPNDIDIWHEIIDCESQLQKWEDVQISYERLLTVDQTCENILAFAQVLESHNPPYAIVMYNLVLKSETQTNEEKADACWRLGTIIAPNNPLQAKKLFEQSIQINSENENSWLGLGQLYEKLQSQQLAQSCYENAYIIGKLSPKVLAQYGQFLILTKQYEKAKQIYQFAVENKYHDDLTFLSTFANILELCGNKEHASRIYEQICVTKNIELAEPYVNFGILLQTEFKNIEKAKKMFAKAIMLDKEYVEGRMKRLQEKQKRTR